MPRSNINLAILPVRPAMDLKLSALHVQQVSVEGEERGSKPTHHHHACSLVEVCVQAHGTDLTSSYLPIVGAPGDTHNKPATTTGLPGQRNASYTKSMMKPWVDLAPEFSGIWGYFTLSCSFF